MTELSWYAVLAAVIAVTIPLVPKMMELRITVLRRLHLNRLANWHQKHFGGIVLWVRLALATVVVVLLVLAFGG